MERLKRTFKKVKDDVTDIRFGLHHDQDKTVTQICNENGFVLKKFKYTTADGYINTVFRLVTVNHAVKE